VIQHKARWHRACHCAAAIDDCPVAVGVQNKIGLYNLGKV